MARTLLWLTFLLSCVVTLEKGYEKEAEGGACYGVLLTGVSPSLVYLAKVTSLTVAVFLSHIVNVILLALLLSVSFSEEVLLFVPLSLPVVLGFSALATIVQPMSLSSKLGGLLLPLLLLPLLFPLFFAASSISSELLLGSGPLLGSFSLTLLLVLDVLYLCVGVNVYEFVIRG
jgi:heme exporter protein B